MPRSRPRPGEPSTGVQLARQGRQLNLSLEASTSILGSIVEVTRVMFASQLTIRRFVAGGIWLLLAAAGVYLFLFEPGQTGFFPTCPFHTLTGFNCPGCGTTRALHQLLHGNVVAAFELNPLTILLLPVLAYALVSFTRSAITGRPMPEIYLPPKLIWLSVFIVFGFWVFRNTPLYPFPA